MNNKFIKKMIIKKHLIISGQVQGVGFRYWMRNLAINYTRQESSGNNFINTPPL